MAASTKTILERFRHNFVNTSTDNDAHQDFDRALAETLLESLGDLEPAEEPKRRGGPRGPRKPRNPNPSGGEPAEG